MHTVRRRQAGLPTPLFQPPFQVIKMSKKIREYTSSLLLLATAVIATSACGPHSDRARQGSVGEVAAKAIESPSKPGPKSIECVQFLDLDHWLIADFDQVWRTEDGGRTWMLSYGVNTDGRTGKHIGGISFINYATGFLIIDESLLRTDDGGKSWNKARDLGFGAHNCFFYDDSHGWAVGSEWQEGYRDNPAVSMYAGRIWATKDGGRTWRRQRINLPLGYFESGTRWSLNDVLFNDLRTGWAVGDGVILWTVDGGEQWYVAEAEKVQYAQVRFINDQFGWATQRDTAELSITTDGGRNWKFLNGPPGYGSWPAKVSFLTPQHGFATLVMLYEAKDGGRTWKWCGGRNEIGQGYDYIGRAQDGALIALGMNEDMTVASLMSVDKGATWQQHNRADDKLVKSSAKIDQLLSPPATRKSEEELLRLAVRKIDPAYPAIANAARAEGDVVVEIIVDEEGNVISARALSGHPLLRDAAVKAAQDWKFMKTTIQGEAVKITGTLTFKFNK